MFVRLAEWSRRSYDAGMTKLRIASAVGFLVLSAVSGFAQSERVAIPLKPAAVPERGLQLPFDLRTEPTMKFRGSDIGSTPTALAPKPNESPRRAFFGIGVTRPIETLK
jgi:hypothetical protein